MTKAADRPHHKTTRKGGFVMYCLKHYKPNSVPASFDKSAGESYLSGRNVATTPQAALSDQNVGARPCTGWGLPLRHVTTSERPFYGHFSP